MAHTAARSRSSKSITPGGALDLFVRREDLAYLREVQGHLAARLRRRDRIVGRFHHARLGPLDLAGQVAGGGAVCPHPAARGGQTDQSRLRLHQLWQGPAVEQAGREEAQLTQRGRVERAGLHPTDAEPGQPVAHLPGRAGGEGDREDVPGVDRSGERPIGDPVGDGSGLASAGAGQHAHRPGGRGDDGDLLGIEPGEDPLRSRC
jgi:hypothetical protein